MSDDILYTSTKLTQFHFSSNHAQQNRTNLANDKRCIRRVDVINKRINRRKTARNDQLNRMLQKRMSNTFFEKKRVELIFKKAMTTEKSFHLMITDISLKCNFTVHKKISVSYARSFKKYVLMNDRRAFVMIDSKISKNFISQQLIDKFETTTRFKKNSYDLMIINENSLSSDDGRIRRKIASVTLMMSNHKKQLFLNIVRMINHDIVLKVF